MPVPDNPIASEPTIKRKRAGAPPVDAASPGGSVLATGVKVFGRYRVEKPIAGGGMGSVYLAVDEETKLDSRRHVVLKALKAENTGDECFRNRFAAESKVPLLMAQPKYCGDNGAMIAGLAYWRRNHVGDDALRLDVCPSLEAGME